MCASGSKRSSGLHQALQLAVDCLRQQADHGAACLRRSRLDAADTLRGFLGRKRLASKLSMRRRWAEGAGKKNRRVRRSR
jgi:hypothetical protein